MTNDEARSVLQLLMSGVDPTNGAFLPEDHVCCEPQVARALQIAVACLRNSPMKNAPRNGKPYAGRPWKREDNAELLSLYETGVSIEEICRKVQRRRRSVEKRLLKLMEQDAKLDERLPAHPVGREWLAAEDEYLYQQYLSQKPVNEIARGLHRTALDVRCRMQQLMMYGDAPGYPAARDREE